MEAVFFDIDFTLIHPGPTFDGSGYQSFATRYGLSVEPSRFAEAVRMASIELDESNDNIYRPDPFIRYAKRVLIEMGACGSALDACAREIYDEWAICHHFSLYEDVRPTFNDLNKAGYCIGLISNTHRCLETFQNYFNLSEFVEVAVSSSDQGYLKPHPSIFHEALRLVGVSAEQGLMVGDSVTHDVLGARQVGMAAVLLVRSGAVNGSRDDGVPEIHSLVELPSLLTRWPIELPAGE
tara:strand:- start:1700 stop:2413 length:714 start_codon:yes stop_codon:yes gene_type:complete